MISVITPAYNGARFIGTCLQVVIDQACPQVEHIVVDGGSTDGTVDVIRRYAQRYPHIRWVSEPDQGQSDAMNKGIAMARGEILGFLNVDDFYEPGVLNRVLVLFETLPEPALLVGNCNVWVDGDKLFEVHKPKKLKITDLLLGPRVNPFPLNPSAYFYHASLHQKIGPYKVGEHYAMDLDFLLRAVQAATIKYVDETWGNYQRLQGTKTFEEIRSGQNMPRVEAMLKAYRERLPVLQRWYVAVLRSKIVAGRWARRRLNRLLGDSWRLYERILGKGV